MPLHRYKFESNSQQIPVHVILDGGWLCHYIDTTISKIKSIILSDAVAKVIIIFGLAKFSYNYLPD
jgi:hypothetical protein